MHKGFVSGVVSAIVICFASLAADIDEDRKREDAKYLERQQEIKDEQEHAVERQREQKEYEEKIYERQREDRRIQDAQDARRRADDDRWRRSHDR